MLLAKGSSGSSGSDSKGSREIGERVIRLSVAHTHSDKKNSDKMKGNARFFIFNECLF